jgi:putative ABC transport system permease protein
MTWWLVLRTARRAPRRIVLGAIGVALPVAMFGATLLFVDGAVRSMTSAALRPVQVEMRGVANSLGTNMNAADAKLRAVPGVKSVERFAAADVVVDAPGAGKFTARLYAVDASYLANRPWLRVVDGNLARGALLDESLRAAIGTDPGTLTISLPGDAPRLAVRTGTGGTIDLRQASTWFSIPYGEVQGDIVVVPRALVVTHDMFTRHILPTLRAWAARGGLPEFDPGSSELPAASLEAHVFVDHAAYPVDPARAAKWSNTLRHVLERSAAGAVIVADNAAEPLTLAQEDATNAKILFLLLCIPGVLVAAALGLAAGSALAEAHRREEALLRLRGATGGQIARIAAAHAALAGIAGSILGLAIAVAGASAAAGRAAWSGIPQGRLAVSLALALGAGAITTIVRLLRLRRAGRRSEVVLERRLLERGWSPLWKRAHLDAVACLIGVAILAINYMSGGLKQSPIEGTSLALSFYVLLAPVALWIGATLLAARALLAVLARRARPERSGPLPSWRGASMRWLGRRPARTGVALVLGALAVAFGTYVLTFAATYGTAKQDDARAALGSDLRLTPGDPRFKLPQLGPDVASVSAFHMVPARAGSDRKTILAVDTKTYASTVTSAPHMISGAGPEALARDPLGVLVAAEIAQSFEVGPGDTLPVTIFPDDFESRREVNLHVLGVFRSLAPTAPITEMVTSIDALPRARLIPPDFYLARVTPGARAAAVASELRGGALANTFAVSTVGGPHQRGLTSLDLVGLGRIEAFGAAAIAALGVAVLGAFLVLERKRESAILRAAGADTAHVVAGPAFEGIIAVVGSIAIGVPLGAGLGFLAVRVLGLFFVLPPPLLTVPALPLVALVVAMGVASGAALAIALGGVTRARAAVVLRET